MGTVSSTELNSPTEFNSPTSYTSMSTTKAAGPRVITRRVEEATGRLMQMPGTTGSSVVAHALRGTDGRRGAAPRVERAADPRHHDQRRRRLMGDDLDLVDNAPLSTPHLPNSTRSVACGDAPTLTPRAPTRTRHPPSLSIYVITHHQPTTCHGHVSLTHRVTRHGKQSAFLFAL